MTQHYSPVASYHSHNLLLHLMDLKNISSKRLLTPVDMANDINILYDGLVMALNMITGLLDPFLLIAKHLMFGLGK